MYHPAELYSGRNTWDSYPAGGPNRGQWAPVNGRPWSHTQRCQDGRNQSHHPPLSRLYNRGERAVNHVQDKGISKGHRQPLRLWEGKDRPFEAQNWHHNSTRSFHNRPGTNNGYLTGPGDRYTNWDNSVSNSLNGGPRLHRNNRELQSPPERWAPSDCRRSFPDRMINNRPGPWKRPVLHQRRDQPHSPTPQHPLSSREECPAKRRRESGPDQPSHPGSRHLPILAHAPSPPRHHRCNQDDWKPLNDRGGPCHHSDHRTSTTQETSKLRAGGHGFSNSNPAAQNQSCGGRPPHHGSRGKVDRKITSSPADHTRVPYSHQNHHYHYQRHTGHPRALQHNPSPHPVEEKDSRSYHHKQSTEPQRIHQRVTSREPAVSKASGAESPPYSSLLCSPKDGGSTASSPRAPSSPSSYTAATGRKDPSVIHQCSPGLSGQQKLQGSPNHTPAPGLSFPTSLTSHAGPKSRFSDVKYRKTSQPLCPRQSPHNRSRANKPEKELEEHKKIEKLEKRERKGEVQKTNRKGEERKRHKTKEEKRCAERKKKRDKVAKKERRLGLKRKVTEMEMFTFVSTSSSSGEAKMSKLDSTTLSPENQGQLPPKHKHRERSERTGKTHRPSANTPHPSCASTQPSSKPENHKMLKKNSKVPKLLVHKHLIQSPPRNTSSKQTSKPTINSSHLDDGPKAKPDDTLPSLLFKALEPLTTACSVCLEKPIYGKEGGQGGVLNAPDLQPVAVMGTLQEMGDNLANTPPVLSWQGSPVSALGEDEEELEKGVISRPVLQPSPTQCLSPPPADSGSIDDMDKEPCEGTLTDYSDKDVSELCDLPCVMKQVEEEEKEEDVDSSGEASASLFQELHDHTTGLDDVFKSLASFLGSQRAVCRGGPFGGPPAVTATGVKYSSSLALGPEISRHEHQEFSPKSDPTPSSTPGDQSPTHTTSDTLLKSRSPTDLRKPDVDAPLQEKDKDIENIVKEKGVHKDKQSFTERTEASLFDGSLSAKLRLTTTHTASLTSLITVSTKDKRRNGMETQRIGTDRKRKQKEKDGGREGEIKIKIKTEEGSAIRRKNKKQERNVSRSVLAISRNAPRQLKDSTKGQIPQENQTQHGKDIQRKEVGTGNTDGEKTTEKKKDVCASEAGNANTKTPHSASSATINTSKLCASTPASKPPCSLAPVDPLKLKALSMGLSKELRILLIKVESAGRQTFNISEVEEQRIPLSKICIQHTASEVIRACKGTKVKGKFKESFLLPAFSVKPNIAVGTPIPREKLNPPTPSIYVSPQ